MTVYLVNPSDLSFGIGVITPRWLFVLAGATPPAYGDPVIVDEAIEQMDYSRLQPGDVVGIGIHTTNALKGYSIGRQAREKGAHVVFGGVHASLYPEEAFEYGRAHATVQGDGDLIWKEVLEDCANGGPKELYVGGRLDAEHFKPARWDLMPPDQYMWASVQTVRGCPKHCSFCSVWRMDGQKPRQRPSDAVLEELVQLRRRGFRFIALADDNFYPVTLEDLELAKKRGDTQRLSELQEIRDERFYLMARLAELPKDMVFMTQITMEAAEDPEFLEAMKRANVKGALVGVESVTEEGLKSIYKGFNSYGDELVKKLRTFRRYGVHVLGSFIFGLPTDNPSTFEATRSVAQRAHIAFAQFIPLTPLPGTVDFKKWEDEMADDPTRYGGQPLTRYWLIPHAERPRIYQNHPVMSVAEVRARTKEVWDNFYDIKSIWERSRITKSIRGRLIFLLMSKLYRQMYANTGISTDSARSNRARNWARMLAKPVRRLFMAPPMQDLQVPVPQEAKQVASA